MWYLESLKLNNMFQSIKTILQSYNLKKRIDHQQNDIDYLDEMIELHKDYTGNADMRLTALEDHLGIKFYAGGKNKPHYRKKKI